MAVRQLILLFLLVATGCRQEEKTVDPGQEQRFALLREHLKRQLGDKYEAPVPAASPDQLKRGGELFAKVCAACHGGRGEGKGHVATALAGTPTNLTSPHEASFFSEQARLYIIRKGMPGTAMMGWEDVLTEQDILALYLYIRSLIQYE
ncbi:MAG: cytochrome c [Calditrichaeota bacterium]|nr:cytochrome c [Calditrichota bacterium]